MIPKRSYAVSLVLPMLLAILGLASASHSGDQTHPESPRIENFALLDAKGEYRELYYSSDARAVVLVVQGNGCPIFRGSVPVLRELRERFQSEGVVFWGINASTQDDRASIAAEAREFSIDFPILVDEAGLVADSLDLRRTAEVLVIDPRGWRIVYRGPIDDRLGYGSQRPVKRTFLAEALDQLLAGDDVRVEAPEVQGCLLARAPRAAVSYAEDIVPILERHCVSCHRPGGGAPWAMTDLTTVRGWSAMMREMIRTRRMPPWHADPRIGAFENDAALATGDARTLVHWIEAGSPAEDGGDPLVGAAQPVREEWPLGAPDRIVEVPAQSVPAAGVVDYRYVEVESPFEHDVWLRAADLRPSAPEVLHHSNAFLVRPSDGAPRGVAEHLTRGLFATYTPGRRTEPFPEGTGVFVPAGSRFRMQLHYAPIGKPVVDRPRLALYVAPQPPAHELRTGALANVSFRIPPRAKEHAVVAEQTLDRDILLYRMTPHMHLRGRSMRFTARYPDGHEEVLLSVPKYDFAWQRQYVLAEPKRLPEGTTLTCRATFDNSEQNPANPDPSVQVHFGEQSWDEMMIGYYQYRAL